MIYLARKDGRVVAHANIQAMMDLDGVSPEMHVSNEEFEAAQGLVRIINGKIFLGKTDEEKAIEAEQKSLVSEETALQKELSEKDYKIIKAAEAGLVLAETNPELHDRRMFCRNRINEIRDRLVVLNDANLA
jgi:hypothetical protein